MVTDMENTFSRLGLKAGPLIAIRRQAESDTSVGPVRDWSCREMAKL